ncbi:molybdopterin biosynthesis protein [Anaerobacillus arseniciselenatis]|uniref:Molybdopterin molybdenumtransferase n=1 Tax=Anaerobacillus arseniciselenatis TaxID=85682 RepID=A0A1S2LJJ8_9BACI|nr:molybdopterin biosynthesis protein [Anaerobacillus arseniciselenatis]OIJ11645.1 molybdopterin biosynthesis protein [Anaerobacillus arseniciselenatis]
MSQIQTNRKVYLQDKPRHVAREEFINNVTLTPEIENIRTNKALGRVTALPIFANISTPHYHASAMDGIAVRAENTYEAHEQRPLHLKKDSDFKYVDTGNPIPNEFNAVIIVEELQEIDAETVEIIVPATPWQNIRPVGEDVVCGEMILPQGHTLRPADLGALLAGGVQELPVVKKPKVAILPTGNELRQPGAPLEPGNIIEFNGTVFAGFVEEWGGDPLLSDITVDDPDHIRTAIEKGAEEADVIIINAGSSAGSKDYTYHVINELGEVYTHGIATRPGKPVILGEVKGKPIIGVPGYPVSAYLALEWFLRPLLYHYQGIQEPERETLKVRLGRRVVSNMGAEDFVRMNVGYVNGEFIANPLTRAAGVTMSMVRADGVLVVPPDSLGLEQGEEVEVELYKPVDALKKAVLFTGSHDLTIDIVSSLLRRRDVNRQVISSHVGSLAGLMAIRKGEAHVTGVHLLDPETETYNVPYIEKYLAGQQVVHIPFLKREQGWIVPKGNPLSINKIDDIVEKGGAYVNRQRGAGTRILFDSLLKQHSLTSEQIQGYEREMFSHLSVAAEVKEKENSVGLGVYSAAQTMGLDFIPVADENYDLVMTNSFYESDAGQQLMEVIRSTEFKQQVERLGGYKVVEAIKPNFFNE